MPHCSFDLYFSDNSQRWALLHMPIDHLYVSFGKVSIYFFCLFFDQILLLFSCMSCLYILEIKPLLVTSFANIFSQSIGCLFIVFMVSFAVQNLVNLIRSYLFIFLIKKKNCGHTWSLLLWCFFSLCDEQGYSRVVVCGLLIEMASPVAEHGV